VVILHRASFQRLIITKQRIAAASEGWLQGQGGAFAGIEEAEGVPDQQPAVAGDLARTVGEIAGGARSK
jgi:hypothetical protein